MSVNLEFLIISGLHQCIFGIVIFIILYYVTKFIFNKIENKSYFKSNKLFNLEQYFPDEQIFELKQIFYLFMIVLFSLNILYLIVYLNADSNTLLLLDVLLSLYLAVKLEKNSPKDYLILFLLMPIASINILLSNLMILPLDFIHGLIFFYYIKIYYDKFMEYTVTNGLGITIILLFFIVFISFLFTIFEENVSPLDSLVMVSNAFTSNGYAILGSSNLGKVNEIFLVWSGFILSGVGTATLVLAIVRKYIDGEFDRLEEMIKKNKKN